MPIAMMSLGAAMILSGFFLQQWDHKSRGIPYWLFIGGFLLVAGQLSR